MPNCSHFTECEVNGTYNETGPLDQSNQTLSFIFSVVLTVMLAMVVFSLGCSVEVGRLWYHLRNPWGICVGLLCQFGLMPLIAYVLSVAFSVQPVQAVAILIMGCCPGGIISNIIAYWIDGDMDLSITMTSCSTVLAMGMMPLCLYIYTKALFQATNITIPFFNIGITLVTLIVPVTGGVFLNYKWPKMARVILKVGSIVGSILILVLAIASGVLYKGSWDIDTSMVIIGVIFPMIGYTAGFVIAFILRQPWKRCRTIALETGAQNVQLCSTVLQLSFPHEQLVFMFTFPLIYGSCQLLDGLIIVTVYQIYKRVILKKPDVKTSPGPNVNDVSVNSLQGEVNIAFEHDPNTCSQTQSVGPTPTRESQVQNYTKL